MKERNEICKKAHEIAVNHGFWSLRNSNEHCLMLVVTEISEIVEADRKRKRANMSKYAREYEKYEALVEETKRFTCAFESQIKDTVEDEFADAYIRLGDLAGELGIDFNKLLPCRYKRSFEKFTFTENAFALVKGLGRTNLSVEKRIQFGMDFLENWAKNEEIDLAKHVELKMKYNVTRPTLHGKAY